jgi:hypothetical protein
LSENAEFIRRSQADAGQGPSVLQVGQASRKAIADGKAVGTLRATDGLPPGTSRSERREVESTIKEGLMGLDGELKGSYYGLYDMTPPQEKQLQDDHLLFQKPDPNAMVFSCGGVRDWPDARGIYHNDDKSFLVWVNEGDQMRVISMQKGGNVAEVFERWAKGANEVEKCLRGKGKEYMCDDHLGQFSSCVSNVGTGLRASMHVLLPELIEQIGQEALETPPLLGQARDAVPWHWWRAHCSGMRAGGSQQPEAHRHE